MVLIVKFQKSGMGRGKSKGLDTSRKRLSKAMIWPSSYSVRAFELAEVLLQLTKVMSEGS